MTKSVNLQNKKFSRLLVINREANDTYGNARWKCKCDCGKESIVVASKLLRGITKSCGCFSAYVTRQRSTIHGQSTRSGKSREYNAWREMKRRCYNKNSRSYSTYGGAGITVADEWKENFSTFYDDMGACPKGYELDRIDNSKGYSKANCRWVSETQQSRNRAYCKLSMDKATQIRLSNKTTIELAEKYGVGETTILDVRANKTWVE